MTCTPESLISAAIAPTWVNRQEVRALSLQLPGKISHYDFTAGVVLQVRVCDEDPQTSPRSC